MERTKNVKIASSTTIQGPYPSKTPPSIHLSFHWTLPLNSGNQWVLGQDCSAGHSFVTLVGHHLVVYIFPFLLSTAQLIAISGPIGEVQRRGFRVLPIFSCPLCCAITIGATIHPQLVGKQSRTKKIREISLTGATNLPRFAYKRRMHGRANKIVCRLYICIGGQR